ncbi:MAG: prepilin peptidase [Patescibacteria group bacterium]|nr:prepilin peptidase [Patescibacteria group bacterium]
MFLMESFFIFFMFLFGLIIGSFLNCLIWRLYKEETVLGRSYCPKCGQELKWYDNIPVLSFIFLKGRCRFCNDKISWQYPLVEIITGLLFAFSYYFSLQNGLSFLELFFYFFVISLSVIIFVFDLRWYLIPVWVVIIGGILIISLNIFFGASILNILLSMLIGSSFFGLQYLITRGKGIGEGDIWLGALFGAIFPDIKLLILSIFLTYIIGGLVAMVLIIFKIRKIGSRLPLGIFLSLSLLIVLFFGKEIVDWYFSLIF